MPNEDKTFSVLVALLIVLDVRAWWLHVNTVHNSILETRGLFDLIKDRPF